MVISGMMVKNGGFRCDGKNYDDDDGNDDGDFRYCQ